MARYRRVETKVWLDSGFRSFSAPQPNAQTLWLYLLCGPRTTIFPGLVVGREEVMASDLGWSLESFRKAFMEASAKNRVKVDWKVGVTVLSRALFDSDGDPRESAKPGNPNILKHWSKEWDQVPECHLKDQYLSDLKRFAEALGEGYTEAFAKALGKAYAKASRNQDQDQDQDQDQENLAALAALRLKTEAAAKEQVRKKRERKPGHPDHVPAREHWMAFWQRRHGQTAQWNGANGKLLNEALAQLGLAEFCRRVDLLEASNEGWYRTWDFKIFASRSDTLLGASGKTSARVEPKKPDEYPEGDQPL